jgi:Zn-finger nucleic acid-binding protein
MRRLIDCPACRRRYDATAVAAGERIRCRCGSVIEVREQAARDAAVVRCSSCGATREEGALTCRYCGSDFTLHEQDLHTLCPGCFARVSDRARFCHHCAAPIFADEVAGELTERACPACERTTLRSRRLGADGISALECTRCGGLWLGAETFARLRDATLAAADPSPDAAAIRADNQTRSRRATLAGTGPQYRRCPVCSVRMNRVNYGRQSGILLDRCPGDGIWFDGDELDAVLRWMRLGGERLAAERDAREAREKASLARFRVEPKAPEDTPHDVSLLEPEPDFLGTLARWLSQRVR